MRIVTPTCPQCVSANSDGSKFCASCGHILVLLTSPQPELPILWKCKSKPRSDHGYIVDWSGSPTFRVTFGAIGQDNSILHLVPVLIGMGMAVPVGSWLLECASSLGPL